ncbi:unnamed protein product [Arabidopsis arenosa]|uniref:Uncharacterized protein n=1 Tax=Arabidopsis arenosa TaxID=38785 RepID=A0A8S2AMQ9_ARAAE|nr:unnamed protein product [Arabidopsis arenosa]
MTDLIPSFLSQVDVSVLQELPEELGALEHFLPTKDNIRSSDVPIETIKKQDEESIDIKDTKNESGFSCSSLWFGNPPLWTEKFKLSGNCTLEKLSEIYYKEQGFILVILPGIGGSTIGPQFVVEALALDDHPLKIRFIDNTDPAGIRLHNLGQSLPRLYLRVSSSEGTPEPRNGLLELQKAFLSKNDELVILGIVSKFSADKRSKNRELQIMRLQNRPNVVRLRHSFFSTTDKMSCISSLNLVLECWLDLECDLFKRGSLYTNSSCSTIPDLKSCIKQGRPDSVFLCSKDGNLMVAIFRSLIPRRFSVWFNGRK